MCHNFLNFTYLDYMSYKFDKNYIWHNFEETHVNLTHLIYISHNSRGKTKSQKYKYYIRNFQNNCHKHIWTNRNMTGLKVTNRKLQRSQNLAFTIIHHKYNRIKVLKLVKSLPMFHFRDHNRESEIN